MMTPGNLLTLLKLCFMFFLYDQKDIGCASMNLAFLISVSSKKDKNTSAIHCQEKRKHPQWQGLPSIS
jgi:hypothetical protein